MFAVRGPGKLPILRYLALENWANSCCTGPSRLPLDPKKTAVAVTEGWCGVARDGRTGQTSHHNLGGHLVLAETPYVGVRGRQRVLGRCSRRFGGCL